MNTAHEHPFDESETRRTFIDKAAPPIFKALAATSQAMRDEAAKAGVGDDLIELVNVRSSQINGCPYCLSVHTPKARAAGLTEMQIALLPAWRDSGVYSEDQRAALAVAEAVTDVAAPAEMDAVLSAAEAQLGQARYAVLVWAAILINSFNRVSITSRHPVRR